MEEVAVQVFIGLVLGAPLGYGLAFIVDKALTTLQSKKGK